jgi:hypothetical protein
MATQKSNNFVTGFLSALAVFVLAGTDAGKSLVTKLKNRYTITSPRIKRAFRIFWIAELVALILVINQFSAERYEAASWILMGMGLPFLSAMFFIKSLFPISKGAIKGFAIPILMIFDVSIMGILIFAPITWTGPVWFLLYFSIVRMLADLGMITGADTNRPYILLVSGVLCVMVAHAGLSWTGYKDRIEKYHQEMYFDNLNKSMTIRVALEDITPYELYDDEVERIASGRKTNINRVISYNNVGTMIPKDATFLVCKWARVVNSITGVPNIVVILPGLRGDYNPDSNNPDSLKKQIFLIPVTKTETKDVVDRANALVEANNKAAADSLTALKADSTYRADFQSKVLMSNLKLKDGDWINIHNPNSKRFELVRTDDDKSYGIVTSDDAKYVGKTITGLKFQGDEDKNRIQVVQVDRTTFKVL